MRSSSTGLHSSSSTSFHSCNGICFNWCLVFFLFLFSCFHTVEQPLSSTTQNTTTTTKQSESQQLSAAAELGDKVNRIHESISSEEVEKIEIALQRSGLRLEKIDEKTWTSSHEFRADKSKEFIRKFSDMNDLNKKETDELELAAEHTKRTTKSYYFHSFNKGQPGEFVFSLFSFVHQDNGYMELAFARSHVTNIVLSPLVEERKRIHSEPIIREEISRGWFSTKVTPKVVGYETREIPMEPLVTPRDIDAAEEDQLIRLFTKRALDRVACNYPKHALITKEIPLNVSSQ